MSQTEQGLTGRYCVGFCTTSSSCDDECDIPVWQQPDRQATCGEYGVCANGVMDCWGGCNMLHSCDTRCIIYNDDGAAMNTWCGNFGCCSSGCGQGPPPPQYKTAPPFVSGFATPFCIGHNAYGCDFGYDCCNSGDRCYQGYCWEASTCSTNWCSSDSDCCPDYTCDSGSCLHLELPD